MSMDEEIQTLSTQFRSAFARELGAPCWLLDEEDALAWKQDEDVHALQLIFRFWPHEASPNWPKIVEVQIDEEVVYLEPDACRYFALDPAATDDQAYLLPAERRVFALRWHLTGDELLDFCPWFVRWIRMRTGALPRVPAPPHAIYTWECGLRESSHAWTVSAYHAYQKCSDEEVPFLPDAMRIAPPPWNLLPQGAEERAWGDLLSAWWKTYGRQWVTTSELRDLALQEALLPGVLGARGPASQAVRLGRALGKILRRPFGTLQVRARRDRRRKARVYALASH